MYEENCKYNIYLYLSLYMHILFDFLHCIHSCEVVKIVITTLARYMYMVFL